MEYLGVSDHELTVYEGSWLRHGRLVYPTPLLVPIAFGDCADGPTKFGKLAMELFREDSFDPVTKIRRGRIYTSEHQQTQPCEWVVTDPLHPEKNERHPGAFGEKKKLYTYSHHPLVLLRELANTGAWPPVLLGEPPFASFWRVIAIEGAVTGVPVVTLRPIQSYEDLPELNLRTVPESAHKAAQHAWDEVAACVHVGNPSDRIDRCRNLLTVVFSYESKRPGLDLGHAISEWCTLASENRNSITACSGQIVARLHSKTKHSEQVSRSLPPATDADSQLALRCTAFVLTHFGWAK